jgi:hypothetical protein
VLERINTDRRFLDAEIREAMRTGAAKIRSNAPAPAAAATTSTNTTAAAAAAPPLTATAAALIGSNSRHSTSSNSVSEGGSRRASRSDTVDVSRNELYVALYKHHSASVVLTGGSS